MRQKMQFEYDPNDKLWDEAYEWAYQRAREEGDTDEDLIDGWAEEYYEYMINHEKN